MKGGWVYIMTNMPHGAPYTGVTADLPFRIWQHREGKGSAFCRKHGCRRLVYVEEYPTIEEAIIREKRVKAWKRQWKLRLIRKANPDWNDLWEVIHE